MPFGIEKLEWCGYPMVKTMLKIYLFDLTEFTNMTDTLTDRLSPHDNTARKQSFSINLSIAGKINLLIVH